MKRKHARQFRESFPPPGNGRPIFAPAIVGFANLRKFTVTVPIRFRLAG